MMGRVGRYAPSGWEGFVLALGAAWAQSPGLCQKRVKEGLIPTNKSLNLGRVLWIVHWGKLSHFCQETDWFLHFDLDHAFWGINLNRARLIAPRRKPEDIIFITLYQ